ncbi:MAG: S8 family serine peptidase [Actinobacteria bacterium]|nr:S8 family serine peptidase [Actinomycetota bacterium]
MSLQSRMGSLLAILVLVILVTGGAVAFASPKHSIRGEPDRKHKIGSARVENGVAVAKQVLIYIKPGVSSEMVEKLNSKVGAKPVSSIRKLGVVKVNLSDTDIAEALRIYRSSGLVEFAEPNYLRKATAFYPNDPLYPKQWGLAKIGMGQAWETAGFTLSPVKVAVLDTGIDLNHEDLRDALAMNPASPGTVLGRRFYTDLSGRQVSDDKIQDNAGHGTHISGIIAGRINNGLGIAGISTAATIIPVKVLDDVGSGDDASIAEGLIWAADNGARVINMSLAGPTPSSTLASAIKYARDKGAVIVAAAGNAGTDIPSYPAAYEGVIGVGAVAADDTRIYQSSFGPYVDVAAPGMSILSTFLPSKSRDGQPYDWADGTSMAAGFVSGLASMILSINPTLSDERVGGILYVTADDLGTAGWDRYYGHGRINASRAVDISSDNNPPTVAITSPADGTKVSGSILTVSASAYDAEGGIAFVELLLNGKRVGVDALPPYIYNVNVSDIYGKSTIGAVAYDINGNPSRSDITCYKQTFIDVDISYWAFQDIEMLAADKVISGYPGDVFRPADPVGRAEFVKMIIQALGLPKKTYYSGSFTDVPITHWAWPYIEAAYEMGIVTGYSNKKFLPENQIKRVEMANILMKSGVFSKEYSGDEFLDVPESYWGYIPVMSARNAGIINGYPGNYFKPEQAMSRAESAKVIKNLLY